MNEATEQLCKIVMSLMTFVMMAIIGGDGWVTAVVV